MHERYKLTALIRVSFLMQEGVVKFSPYIPYASCWLTLGVKLTKRLVPHSTQTNRKSLRKQLQKVLSPFLGKTSKLLN